MFRKSLSIALGMMVLGGMLSVACSPPQEDLDGALDELEREANEEEEAKLPPVPPAPGPTQAAPKIDPPLPSTSAAVSKYPLKGPDCDGLVPFSYLGKLPDQITTADLMAGQSSTYLQPEASAAWERLVAAAVADGIPKEQLFATGWGMRPPENKSVHPIGLAVDVNYLADPIRSEKFRNVAGEPLPISDSFFTPVFQWLYRNSWRFGWCTTRNNRPLYLNGTATGGRRTDGSFYGLEAWHFEYVSGAEANLSRIRTPSKTDKSGPFGIAD